DEAASAGSFVTGGDTVPTTVRSAGFYALTIKLHLSGGTALTIAATEPGTRAPTSPHTAPPEFALESDLVAHEDLTTAAHGGLIPSSAAGTNGGVATLDTTGRVPTSQLP